MDLASNRGKVLLLNWWKDFISTTDEDCQHKWSKYAMDFASGNGYIEILEWWRNYFEIPTRSIFDRTRKSSGLKCKWSKSAMDSASMNGQVKILQWME
jgi:hypothetical protein